MKRRRRSKSSTRHESAHEWRDGRPEWLDGSWKDEGETGMAGRGAGEGDELINNHQMVPGVGGGRGETPIDKIARGHPPRTAALTALVSPPYVLGSLGGLPALPCSPLGEWVSWKELLQAVALQLTGQTLGVLVRSRLQAVGFKWMNDTPAGAGPKRVRLSAR